MSKFAVAGRELIKGNIGNAIMAIANKDYSGLLPDVHSELIEPSRYRGGNFFFGVFGADKAFIWGNINSSLRAYQQCPIVSTVINRQAQCSVNGLWKIRNKDKQESNTKAAVSLRKLLRRPNPLQSGIQFKAQCQVYKRIYGWCPILIIRPVGFENDYSTWKLWNIPPWMLQVIDNTDFFFKVGATPFASIRLTYMGHSVELNPKDIFFLKENQISTGMFMSNSAIENVSLFLPDSKLFPIEKNICTFNESLLGRGVLNRERGPRWILSNDSGGGNSDAGLFPNDPVAIEQLHEDFKRYGIQRGQRSAIITDAQLKLQTVGFDVAQLKLLEGEVQDAKAICDQLNYPPELLGLIDSKYDNQDVAERALYTNSIIPDAVSEDEQWGDLFGLETSGDEFYSDFTGVAALQENMTETGRGRWYMDQALQMEFNNDLITYNEWRVALGMDPIAGRDKYRSELVAAGVIAPTSAAAPASDVSSDSANNDNNGKGKK